MTHARRLLTIALLAVMTACADPTVPDPSFGRGGSTGDPTVTGTSPTGAGLDTTLDVRVFGTNYDRSARADLALAGVVGPKVRTNSTRYVSATELVANVTIALDADTGAYDVVVTLSTGKKGIGTEMFGVRKGPKPPPPPANPEIVFTYQYEVWVMNADGSNKTLVLSAGHYVYCPSWAPGGDSILVNHPGPAGWGVYAIPLAGDPVTKGQRLVVETPNEGGAYCHTVTARGPDGKFWVAYTRRNPGSVEGARDLWVIKSDSTEAFAVTSTVMISESQPAFSPDGQQVAAQIRDYTDGSVPRGIWVYDVDFSASHQQDLTPVSITPPELADAMWPDWSPAGDAILATAWTTYGTKRTRDIWVIPLVSPLQARNVTNTADRLEDEAAWSPDGSRIGFVGESALSTRGSVWSMRSDGTDLRDLGRPSTKGTPYDLDWRNP